MSRAQVWDRTGGQTPPTPVLEGGVNTRGLKIQRKETL